jgi:uncharacterized repeat protein (TIGR03803 family)
MAMRQTSIWLSLRTAHIAQAVTLTALLILSGCASNDGSDDPPANPDPPGAAHTLSATVSGLNSSGLALRIGPPVGDGVASPRDENWASQEPPWYQVLSVGAATTSLSLASALPAGASYSVSVSAQPTGETCSVASGSGLMSSANVANVVVTCSDLAYALGGAISGLNGSGLVLANDSDTLAVSAGAARFTMPAAVAYTSSYALIVQTQPPGLACAVQNGSGSMPAAPVTDVSVTCTDQPFSLGGSISALGNNTGLVLKNGSDTLMVAAGSTGFTMPTAVSFSSAYSVVVQSSPAGLTCTASNASGTMPPSNVTGIVVACSDQAYNVGGTISGLASGGLVLANGSNTLPVSSGASGFTMPTAVAYTSTYVVTVQTQPTGLTCSVSHGAGTMGTSAVTDVAVTCSANTYTVGGTISGLNASGLVLLDNGVDATTISANATQFSMNSAVAYGSAYAITVQTAPAELVCSVSNGTGTMGAADVSSVGIGCVSNFTLVYSFAGGHSDGAEPYHSLIQNSAGAFVGSTLAGGASLGGTVFEVTSSGTESILYSFASMPWAGVIQGSDGNYYGTTASGGTNGRGTIFELTPGGVETVLYSFPANGSDPYCGLVESGGNFYGTTGANGASDDGTVFELSGGTESVLHTFPKVANGDGQTPYAGLIQGSDGNFYGTTYNGGSSGFGTVFRVTPSGTESIVYSFAGGSGDGEHPYAGVIQGNDGNLYGTTYQGGTGGYGTVFKLTLSGTETVLHSFAGGSSDGANPAAGLTQGTDGNFYGATYVGGASNLGTVFKITPSGTETLLHTFAGGGSDGANPQANLVQGTDGNLYGTTVAGGASADGTFFKISLQ